MAKVLEGIRALDFSRFVAGPYCGMLLAAMGAEVIRVEPPGGEIDRDIGPYAPTGEGMYPWHFCCNKKGITLNLRAEKGKEILQELVKRVDVVIEAFVPRAKRAMGLEYETLKEINPGIILVSVSGFGQYGPYANRGSFDAVAQGMSGMMAVTGFPGGPPLKTGTVIVDYATGVYGALGTMFALYHREKTGVGQAVDVCLLDTAISFMETVFAEYVVLGQERRRIGNRRPFTAPTDMLQTKDGYVNISVSTDRFWRVFAKLTDKEEYLDDPRYNSNRVRYKSQEFLNALAAQWAQDKTADEVVEAMEEAGIPCGPVYTVPQVMADPHVKAREMIVDVEYPVVGNVPVPGLAIKLSETPGRIEAPGPAIGQHNEEVYSRLLGYSREQVLKLKEEGVI